MQQVLVINLSENSNVRKINKHYILETSRQRSWLRHCAISQKVAGSNPDKVMKFLYWLNPSSLTTVLGSTGPLREMSTTNRRGDKGRPVSKANNLIAICEPTVSQRYGTPRPVTGEWSTSRTGRFIPDGRASCTHCTESWVDSRAVLTKIEPRLSSPYRVSMPTELSRLLLLLLLLLFQFCT
jgi:hypothetical protein